MLSATSVDLCKGDGARVTSDGATAAAEKLEHFNAQAADFPQSPFACFSQCCPCVQHSCAALKYVSAEKPRVSAPATGRMVRERAVKATTMARTMLMARSGLSALLPPGQVT